MIIAAMLVALIVMLSLLDARTAPVATRQPPAARPSAVKQPPAPRRPPKNVSAPRPPAPTPRRPAPKPPPKKKLKKTETAADASLVDTTVKLAPSTVTETASEDPLSPPVLEGDLVPLEDVDVPPKPLAPLVAACPPVAARMRWTATTQLLALISASGEVEETRTLRRSGKAILDDRAAAAMRIRRYTPALKNGVRVKTWIPIEIKFACAQR